MHNHQGKIIQVASSSEKVQKNEILDRKLVVYFFKETSNVFTIGKNQGTGGLHIKTFNYFISLAGALKDDPESINLLICVITTN